MSCLLIASGVQAVEFALDAAATAKKAELLAAARACTSIGDSFELDCAVDAAKEIKSHLDALESARVEVKRPVDELAKRIQSLAKEHADGLTQEAERLSRMIGEHQLAERRKAEEARRKAEAEEARILAEAREKERARVAEETKARTGTLNADLGEIRAATEEKIVEVRIAAASQAAAVAALAPKGTQVRTSHTYECHDAAALFAARPDLITLEPNGAAIRAQLKNPVFLKAALAGQVPGLRVREEVKASL